MAEVTATDPLAVTEATSGEAPAEVSSDPVMGQGLIDADTPAEDPDDGTGHTGEEAAPADAQGAAATETDAQTPEEMERGYLRQDDYTRKTTELANQVRALQEQQTAFATERQTFLTQYQALIDQQRNPAPLAESERIRGLATQAETESDRAGFGYLADVIAMNERLSQELSALTEQVNQQAPQITETAEATNQLAQQRQNELLGALQKERVAAVGIFGEELVQEHQGFWSNNLTQTKPDGSFYSIGELVAMKSGRSLEEAQKAKAGNGQARTAAKRTLRAPGPAAPAQAGGSQTRDQAIAEMKANDPSLS